MAGKVLNLKACSLTKRNSSLIGTNTYSATSHTIYGCQ